jgi:hypothetical protein
VAPRLFQVRRHSPPLRKPTPPSFDVPRRAGYRPPPYHADRPHLSRYDSARETAPAKDIHISTRWCQGHRGRESAATPSRHANPRTDLPYPAAEHTSDRPARRRRSPFLQVLRPLVVDEGEDGRRKSRVRLQFRITVEQVPCLGTGIADEIAVAQQRQQTQL